MMIGMIGAGKVAIAFSRYLLASGHEVQLSNSRGPLTIARQVAELGSRAQAVTAAEAAANNVVLLAVPWARIEEALTGLPPWDNRTLIDATNPYIVGGLENLHGRISSEIVTELAPGANLVKPLNTLVVENFESGAAVPGGRRVVFMSGDDHFAKKQFRSLLFPSGFAIVDLGTLQVGGLIQQAGGPLVGPDFAVLS
jgi:predicted dinucleotide-binding enzyme